MAFIPAADGLRALPAPTGRGVLRGVAWLAHNEPPLVAHGTSSKRRSCFYVRERLSVERRKQDSVGKVQMSTTHYSTSVRVQVGWGPFIPRLKPGLSGPFSVRALLP